jgi:predicted CXXCH cytochrome family protein
MLIVVRRRNLRGRVFGLWHGHDCLRAPYRTWAGIGLVVVALLVAGTAAANGAFQDDTCVRCHSAIPQAPRWQHTYEDWQDSLHANVNVDCHSCHGGDAHATDAKKAHEGMVPVGGPDTPQTRLMAARVCGACHPDKYWGFSHSRHFQRLQEGKPAAYCHTCHTSVGSRVLTPQTIAAACRKCHDDESPGSIPQVAETLLTHLYQVRLALTFRDPEAKLTTEQWRTVSEAATAAMNAWHSFDLPAVDRALARGIATLDQ